MLFRSGLVGNSLIKSLIQSKNYTKIISLGRRKVDFEVPKLIQYVIDFEQLDELDIKADTVFCCLGTTIKKAGSKETFRKVDFDYPKMLASYALKIGVKSYHIITAMGAGSNSKFFYNRVKGEIEDELRNLEFEQLHIYRPSLLLGQRQEQRTAEGIGQAVMKVLSILFVGPLKNYKAIKAEKVAWYMLHQSLISKKGSFIHLSGAMQH